jgi:hypothetical protein
VQFAIVPAQAGPCLKWPLLRKEEAMAHDHEVHLAGRAIRPNKHICAFFNSKEEECGVMMPFPSAGLAHGHRCFGVIDPAQRSAHLEQLDASGIAVDEAECSGHLEMRPWQDVYCSTAISTSNA